MRDWLTLVKLRLWKIFFSLRSKLGWLSTIYRRLKNGQFGSDDCLCPIEDRVYIQYTYTAWSYLVENLHIIIGMAWKLCHKPPRHAGCCCWSPTSIEPEQTELEIESLYCLSLSFQAGRGTILIYRQLARILIPDYVNQDGYHCNNLFIFSSYKAHMHLKTSAC